MSKKDKIELKELDSLPEVLDGHHRVIPIVTGEDDTIEEVSVPEVLPVLTLRSSVLFLMPARVGERRGVGMFARWSTQSVRPRSALAKAAVLCTASFSFAHTVLRGGVDSVHK